jgi:rhomboid protease GluP
MGSIYTPTIKYDYQLWRLVTPIFLHSGYLHIIFNAMSLLIYGFVVEAFFGKIRFLSTFFLSMITGNLYSIIFRPYKISVGSNSVLYGIMALYTVFII